MEKVLLICGESSTVINFRKSFIETLINEGKKVYVIFFGKEREKEILELGVEGFRIDTNNRDINPLSLFKLKKIYEGYIKKIKPDIVMTFMLKPNIFGTLAAAKIGVKKIINMVEGAGDVFINNGIKWKLIRTCVCMMYKRAFSKSNKIIFLNKEDKIDFINRKLLTEEKTEIIQGIGVNIDKFKKSPFISYNTFLMVARMLKTKGVLEYCESARIIKKTHPEIIFNYAGGEGTIKQSDIQSYIDDDSINYLGLQNNMLPIYQESSVFILPSYYREGVPVSIMEAESVGRPIITTDNNGCRETIEDGYNGFIIPIKDVNALVEKITWFINNKNQIEIMGNNSRELVERKFDSKKINKEIMDLLFK